MNRIYRIGVIIAMVFTTAFAKAQTPGSTDIMRSNGKIFVVMAVIIIIMTGFFIYLISVDRKVSRLEKNK